MQGINGFWQDKTAKVGGGDGSLLVEVTTGAQLHGKRIVSHDKEFVHSLFSFLNSNSFRNHEYRHL
jgi:hypothetical protein